jgi:hypothetical protein
MAIREGDALPYLRLKQKMEPSTCNAVLKNGEKVEVLMYQGKPAIEINDQFFFADTYPEFARFELKPVAPPLPAPAVQLVNEPVEEPVAGSESVQMVERYNSGQLYRRNLVRENFGVLNVESCIGKDPQTSMKYYRCKCKCGKKDCYVVASQGDLLMQRVNSHLDKKPIPPGVTNDSPHTKAGLF